jgi:hypothetical protein
MGQPLGELVFVFGVDLDGVRADFYGAIRHPPRCRVEQIVMEEAEAVAPAGRAGVASSP